MKINVTKIDQPVRVVILHLDGTLDGSNHQSLFEKAQKLYTIGMRDILLDLSKLTFISSAGLGAIHRMALLFQGKKHLEQDEAWAAYRWATYRATDRGSTSGPLQHIKLFSPTKEVRGILDTIGFTAIFEIYDDLQQATASFRHLTPMELGSGLT